MALKKSQPVRRTIQKSARRMPLDEFAIGKGLRPEITAGFRAWLKGSTFHSEDEWSKLLEQYKNRTL